MHLAGWSPAKHLCLTVEITYQHKAWVNWIKKSLCAEKVDGIRLVMEENKGKKNKCRVNRWLRPVAEPESLSSDPGSSVSCVTRGKSLDFSVSQFTHSVGNSMSKRMYLKCLWNSACK